jgi:hypothetical protein
MNHKILMAMTESMPMKTIVVEGNPYLERYFAGYSDSGGQWWYHRFVRADSEKHLHTHPWEGRSMILTGGYLEESRQGGGVKWERFYRVGDFNNIFPETLHRIVEIIPNTWTLLHIKPERKATWKFISDDGSEVVVNASPENWHENARPRGKQ